MTSRPLVDPIGLPRTAATNGPVRVWLTTEDLSQRLSPQPALSWSRPPVDPAQTIRVDEGRPYQQMLGFGATFTDTAAHLLWERLVGTQRDEVMRHLFDPADGDGIRLSVLRQPAGATDFVKDVGGYYTYDDVPVGDTDPDLRSFSIAHDEAYLIPALQDALRRNPALKVMLSSWTAPAWMKTNGALTGGGSLKPECYGAYADYLVKALAAYQAKGIPIWATSAQNEPSVIQTYPSMTMSAAQSAAFVGEYLAPALAAAGLQPMILAGDDVCFDAGYPAAVLADDIAAQECGGVAMHGYCGDYPAMSTMHDLAPYVAVYQTELSPGVHFRRPIDLIIGSARNWAQCVITWNIALNPRGGPFHKGDASGCYPLVVIDDDGLASYTSSYYQLGHASRFVARGARRVDSQGCGPVQHVAFVNPDGEKVLVAHNTDTAAQPIVVRWASRDFEYCLAGGAVATFTWQDGISGGSFGWGSATFGNAAADQPDGQRAGVWDIHDGAAVDSTEIGAGWHSTYLGYADLTDYTFTARVRGVRQGLTSESPRFGIYACYRDEHNYVQGWFDPGSHCFVTHSVLDGRDIGWNKTVLPDDFDFATDHMVTASRLGSIVRFRIDDTPVATAVAPAARCQVGLVTEDHTALFRDLSVVDPQRWRCVTGDWILAGPRSVSSIGNAPGPQHVLRGDPEATNVSVAVSMRLIEAGPSARYGVLAGYRDEHNYVSATVDPNRHILVAAAVTDGRVVATREAALGTDRGLLDTMRVEKQADHYAVVLGQRPVVELVAHTGGSLSGLTTEQSRVNFRNIAIH